MDKAKEYLRCTGMRSSEIAGEVGYKDAHYFSYLFKKTQGMTPSDYRKAREERHEAAADERSKTEEADGTEIVCILISNLKIGRASCRERV